MKEIIISENEQGQRFDKFLLKYFNDAPKSFIYKMLRKKRIKLNKSKAAGNEVIVKGDTVQLFISDDTISSFKSDIIISEAKRDFKIVFEDSNIIICNKPSGLLTQPDSENTGNTLNEQLLYYLYKKGEISDSFKPGVCNRLDRNTSGIVLMGKNLSATQALNKAIKNNEIDKYYITIVKGKLENGGTLNLFHNKDKNNTVSVYSEEAGNTVRVITEYNPLISNGDYTLVNVKLITGKAHQIRASFKYIGFPVIGDIKYGDSETNKYFKIKFGLKNQFLHAYKIVFNQENSAIDYLYKKEFTAAMSSEMNNICAELFGSFDIN